MAVQPREWIVDGVLWQVCLGCGGDLLQSEAVRGMHANEAATSLVPAGVTDATVAAARAYVPPSAADMEQIRVAQREQVAADLAVDEATAKQQKSDKPAAHATEKSKES